MSLWLRAMSLSGHDCASVDSIAVAVLKAFIFGVAAFIISFKPSLGILREPLYFPWRVVERAGEVFD
jgi:hypothetical protein